MGWNYLSISKLQRCCRWRFGIDRQFHSTLYVMDIIIHPCGDLSWSTLVKGAPLNPMNSSPGLVSWFTSLDSFSENLPRKKNTHDFKISCVSGHSLTTATWRWHKRPSQWQRSFQMKLRCHWLKRSRPRHVAIVRRSSGVTKQGRLSVMSVSNVSINTCWLLKTLVL